MSEASHCYSDSSCGSSSSSLSRKSGRKHHHKHRHSLSKESSEYVPFVVVSGAISPDEFSIEPEESIWRLKTQVTKHRPVGIIKIPRMKIELLTDLDEINLAGVATLKATMAFASTTFPIMVKMNSEKALVSLTVGTTNIPNAPPTVGISLSTAYNPPKPRAFTFLAGDVIKIPKQCQRLSTKI